MGHANWVARHRVNSLTLKVLVRRTKSLTEQKSNAGIGTRRYWYSVSDRRTYLKSLEYRIRWDRFVERHPDLVIPDWLTSGRTAAGFDDRISRKLKEKNVRAYRWDREKVFAGVIMENVIRSNDVGSR
jgi:hypothetical protein